MMPLRRRDRALRERQALEIHDNIVQGLAAIGWALEAGMVEEARALTEETLAQAEQIVGRLLEDHPDGEAFGPGSLRRDDAAG
jgi:hypothetical protein